MSELKPCPFCGSEKVKIILEHDRDCGRCWFVRCNTCYAHGASIVERIGRQEPDKVKATNEAAKAWNRRANDE